MNLLKHWLVLAALAAAPLLRGGDGNIGVSALPAPDTGTVSELPAIWKGGEGRPSTVTLTIRIPGGEPLSEIALKSRSINRWWAISGVTLEGVRDGKTVKLATKPWFVRGEDDTPKVFAIKLNPGAEGFSEYRLSLRRPHGFLHMELSELNVVFAGRLQAEIRPERTLFRAGGTVSGTVKLNNPFPSPVSGRLKLFAGETCVWESALAVPPGESESVWSFPAAKPETFRLTPRFESDAKLAARSTGELRILPKRSRYRMSVGTAHGSAQSAALGFTVRHDWSDASGLSDRVLSSIVREQSLSRSNCGVTFETAEDGRYMVNANGETLKNIAMHVPRRLGAETAGVFDELNGHPGLEEIVYYNEHGYHTWHVRGLADYSKHTLRLYRDWLKERYRDISALNRLYGTNCRDFSGIEPPRKFTGPSAAWFDWMEFRRYSVAQYFREAYSLIKPHLPDTPIMPKPINFDYYAVSTAADPWLLRDACDVYGYDIYPFQREGYLDPAMSLDFHRTQVGERPLKFLESNFEFRRVNQTEKSPADMHLLYMPAFLRGLKGVYFYCWHQAWTQNHRGFWLCGPDGVLTPQGRGAAQVAKAAQTLAPVLMTGRVPPATAAVYFPWEEISQTPNVAPISAMRGAYKLMTQLHYPTDIISHHNIAAGELTRYRVLLLPLSRHLRPETAQRIAEFVRAGGILIAEYQAGRFDQFHRETDSLRGLLGGKSLGTTDAFKSFDAGDDKGIRLYAPITKETPFGWRHRPNVEPIDRAERIAAAADAEIPARFPDGSPAAIERTAGRGRVLYFAATFFNSYRNYFYTLNTLPNPATRGNEIINVGDPAYRRLLRAFLDRCEVRPPIRPALGSDDVETDDSPFQILSRFGNAECILFGIANWGPHERHAVAFEADVPFEIRRLFVMDTVRETLKELPFRCEKGVLSTTLPQLGKSLVLIAMRNAGPLLAVASQPGEGKPVAVRVMNFLPEQAAGTLQLRVDGIPAPLSEPLAFTLSPGEEKCFELEPDRGFDAALLRDKRGERLPWYVWITYDGDARAFARVHANPEGLSAP